MKATRANSRNEELLEAAAALFATRGFVATSMRDIAKAADMLPGSIYYHFPSKDDLLLAIYRIGVARITEALDAAIEPIEEPWERLTAAISALVEAVTEESSFTRVIFKVSPDEVAKYTPELIAFRDSFERYFRILIDQLPLAPWVDRHLLRLLILGAGNHAQLWYTQGGRNTAQEIGEQFCRLVREAADSG